MSLFIALALLCGIQPMLTRFFIASTVTRTSLILATELIKLLIGTSYLWHTDTSYDHTVLISLARALPPSVLYLIQNHLVLYGSQYLSPLYVSLLGQTKILSTAIFGYFILGKIQNFKQRIGLAGLVIGATVLDSFNYDLTKYSTTGALAILASSFLSGISSVLSELALSGDKSTSNSIIFSMELAIFSILTMICTDPMNLSPVDWNIFTLLPVCNIAIIGILAGLVTQREGGLRKGIAFILGIMITGILESILIGGITFIDCFAILIICSSTYIHALGSKQVIVQTFTHLLVN